MFERWRTKRQNREVVDRAYEAVVARARRPELYLDGGLPDTVMGRFEALGIEVFLLLDRCRGEPALAAFAQDLVDRFMLDIDHSLREIGIGYQGVPRRMRKLAGRFYARVRDFEAPLAARDAPALERAVEARIFAEAPAPTGAAAFLAAHMIATARFYSAIGTEAILSARLAGNEEMRHAG